MKAEPETPPWAQVVDGPNPEAETQERLDLVRQSGFPLTLFGRFLDHLNLRYRRRMTEREPVSGVMPKAAPIHDQK